MPARVKPGDVFTAQLPDGRYKAVRVLQTDGKASLVCTTEYLGIEPPTLDEPLLRKTVVQNRFFFKQEPARHWLDGPPSSAFQFLGNLPLTKKEAAIECRTYAGKWNDSCGNQAFLE